MFIKTLSAVALGFTVAAGLFGAGATHAQTAAPTLEIGYLPILPAAQLFVALENGSLQAANAPKPKLVAFQSGPALSQALLAGQLDVAYVGIGPALVARAKGADVKVVATNVVEQVNVVALGELAPYFASGDKATAFARFAKDKGRKATIASYPKGSVPEAALQYWLTKKLKVNPADVNVVYQGEAPLQQSLLTAAIDGAATLEPTVSAVLAKVPKARVVARGSELFPNQPGAVLLVREKLLAQHPDVVKQLVAAHIAATAQLRDAPARAAPAVQKYVGGGRLEVALVEKAIRNSHDQFIADPRKIIGATRELQDFQVEQGAIPADARADVGTLFDLRYFSK